MYLRFGDVFVDISPKWRSLSPFCRYNLEISLLSLSVISPFFLFSSKDISFINFFNIFHQQLLEILQEDISFFHAKLIDIYLFSAKIYLPPILAVICPIFRKMIYFWSKDKIYFGKNTKRCIFYNIYLQNRQKISKMTIFKNKFQKKLLKDISFGQKRCQSQKKSCLILFHHDDS